MSNDDLSSIESSLDDMFRRLGLPTPDLLSRLTGDWDGLAASAVDRDALNRFRDDPDASPPPGGECWSALVARVSDAIADLAPVPTLVVTHGGAMRAALHHLCGFGQRQLWAFDLPCASLLSLRVWPGERPGAEIVGLSA